MFRARLMLVSVLMLSDFQGRCHWNGYAGERPSLPFNFHRLNISVLHTNSISARFEREGRNLGPREVDVGQCPAYPLNVSVLLTHSLSTNSISASCTPVPHWPDLNRREDIVFRAGLMFTPIPMAASLTSTQHHRQAYPCNMSPNSWVGMRYGFARFMVGSVLHRQPWIYLPIPTSTFCLSMPHHLLHTHPL